MERPKFKWCRETIEQIRFKPDRDRVWNELMAHIEDRVEDMKTRGYTEEEAEARAVTAMGDPVEVGKQLDKVHKPWLGWLWRASRVILFLCIFTLVWTVWFTSSIRIFHGDDSDFWEKGDSEYVTILDLYPNCEDKSDGYTFTVPRVQLIHTEAHTVNETYQESEKTSLQLTVQATRLLPTMEKCRAFHDFYVVDDLGNRYESSNDMVYYKKALMGNYYRKNPWASIYQCWIRELDPDAQWVELRYDRDGRDVSLRIYLTGGGQL